MLKIFVKKNKDYGASYNRDDVIGIVVRLGDKLQRLKQITREGHQIMVRGESLEDTLIDIANYSAIGLMMLQKKNGKEKGTCSCHKS